MAKAMLHHLGSSISFGRLSLVAKVLWTMLLTSADDQGRGSADPDVVKWQVCPNVPELTPANIPGALHEMAQQEMLHLYSDGRRQLYQIIRWWDYQQLQWARPSRFRPPAGWTDRIRTQRGRHHVSRNWDTPGGFLDGPPPAEPAPDLAPAPPPALAARPPAGPAGQPPGNPPDNPPGDAPGHPAGEPPGDPPGRPPGDPAGQPPGRPPGNPPGQPPGDPPGQPPGDPPGNPPGRPPGAANKLKSRQLNPNQPKSTQSKPASPVGDARAGPVTTLESPETRPKRGQNRSPPAVLAFRRAAHRYPAKSWYADVDKAVGREEPDLQFWHDVVKAWVGLGWNPTNVSGMLDCYSRRQLPGRDGAGNARASPQLSPFEDYQRWLREQEQHDDRHE